MKIRLLAIFLPLVAASADAQEIYSGSLNFATADQSLWSSGSAFTFNYDQFFGTTVNPAPNTFNPAKSSGGSGLGAWSVDPYFLFDTNLKMGIQVGADLTGGSINSNLDYNVAFNAPDTIVKGQAFSLSALSNQLGSSGFTTQSPNASAYVDGIVQMYLGGYMRFVTSGAMGSHDYRMGNKGFTDNNTSNTVYRTLINANLSPEIVSLNRVDAANPNGSGQLRVAGIDQGGVGSEYNVGPTTITAGDWRVAPTGTLNGGTIQGSDQTTLLTATLDVDQLATGGQPVLGTGVAHDWGVIAVDLGYDAVDLKASLAMGLQQNLSLDSSLAVTLHFSDDVLVNGVATKTLTGAMDALPDITLLTDSVTVTPEFSVDALLNNDTKLTFDGGLALTVLAAHAKASYDFNRLFSNYSGTVVNQNVGPFYSWSDGIPLFDIGVYNSSFALGGFQSIQGDSFVLSAVPEPENYALLLAGLGLVGWRARRRG
jgi:hypothetical protein